MNTDRFLRFAHKWLALAVGIQLLLWAASGFYMVVVDLDFIHGDQLVRNLKPELDVSGQFASFDSLRRNRFDINAIRLRALPDDGSAVYEIVTAAGIELIDARTGHKMPPLPERRVIELARAYYAGNGNAMHAALIASEADKPGEIQSQRLPLWRVDFDDWLETSLYLHPDTGQLATRRHRFWRWFDFLWSLHIMDYRERTDVNNWLLRFASVLGTTTVITGLWLTYFSFDFFKRRRRKRASR
ncbi:MAG: PepSY domain-containing protein [Steroidobacteraceae bacterium]